MPSFKPFASVTGRKCFSLFEIRLENEFIVFRGSDHESAGQQLKGTVVLCLPSSLKVESISLKLTGSLRLAWSDSKVTTTGIANQKVDRATNLLEHAWPAFEGGNGKSVTLPAGNYEWPFEYTLPGNTAESVEGIPEASITYRLKASIIRGKLASDMHTYKPLRIIRTLDPGALEFLHAMSVENIWPNKIDYSIVIPQKAIVFGTSIPISMRFTPLLKGLEMGEITAKMMEIREVTMMGSSGLVLRERRTEREVSSWTFTAPREECWQNMIEDTGQEGWTLEKKLNLPKKLRQCVQDLNHNGIKIRHKLKLTVALKNPDGHISELRATLPMSIFISPNMPFDEQGNLVDQTPGSVGQDQTSCGAVAPPVYGEHVLDQLYENIDMSGFRTPAPGASGLNTPYYSLPQSRAGSTENLSGLRVPADGITAAALSSRLQSVRLDASQRNVSFNSLAVPSATPSYAPSAPLTRSNSLEDHSDRSSAATSGRSSPEHIDLPLPELEELNKVPSYATAVKTPPARLRAFSGGFMLPNYETATAPTTPVDGSDPLATVGERLRPATSAEAARPRTTWPRPSSIGGIVLQRMDSYERRRVYLLQARA